jgi:NADPH-dependent ferric siderophore reductase
VGQLADDAVTAPIVRRSPVHTGTVVANQALTPRMSRVTVRADALRGLAVRPAQDLELHLVDETGRRVKRRYTIRRARPDDGEADLDVLLHGAGAGSTWGERARPGDEVRFQGPRGKLELRHATYHVLCGDESALPAIAAIAEALPDDETSIAVIEVRDSSDELPVPGDVRWVHRGAHPAGTPELLLAEAAEIDVPYAWAQFYLLGETRSMVALRALFEGRGALHDTIFVKGYWNIGRPDRISGTAPNPPPR